ncbi:MAG: AAA family ATPase [Methylococcales bacterium]|nr:AAA family ATPase [Methylococcales bacterium]MDD5755461.1 AAA family ATPase [Methylococcales bacterium]
MTTFLIHQLKVTNFRSIDSLTLENVQSFSTFAGANGCGKSNFFNALDFVSVFVRSGIHDALRKYGGYEHIHSNKRRKDKARCFDFEIDISFSEKTAEESSRFKYVLSICELDQKTPRITEKVWLGNDNKPLKNILKRDMGREPIIFAKTEDGKTTESTLEKFPADYSALLLFSDLPLGQFLRNIRLYRIDPIKSKEPSGSEHDSTSLNMSGDNLASVLGRLEQDNELREIILEWMETIVPSIEKINTEWQKLNVTTAILFREIGTRRQFPAHMVSDGTIYALCLLVAVLDSPKYGLTLIEEPERGLHPKAINELVSFIREQSQINSAVWMSTHSEAIVRSLYLEELWLVDKKDGKTRMQNATKQGLTDEDFAVLGLDKAWLSNLLDGGLPW